MALPRIRRDTVAAAVVAAASLAVPLLGAGERGVAGAAGSVTARAAQHVEQPAAARFPLDGPLFQNAQRIAAEHWGDVGACGGTVAVTWQALAPGTNATATWRNPTDAWNNAAANFDCSIELNTDADYDFAKLCTVLAHEVGHLLGRPHAEQPGDLMSPLYSTPLPACEAAAPPGAPDADEDPDEAVDDLDELAGEDVAAQGAPRAASTRKTSSRKSAKRAKRSARRSLRKARSAKRCVRRFAAGRRAAKTRCTRVARQAKRKPARVKAQSPA